MPDHLSALPTLSRRSTEAVTTHLACRTGDRGLITEDSGLVILGRLDEVVKVSGVP